MTPVTVYRRRGCPFCLTLETALRLTGTRYTRRDIWQDPEAAAFVRGVNGGDETVPTVVLGEGATARVLTNPAPWTVVAAARR